MNIIMTGGGTGGHIYPALAIADKFKAMNPDNNILYIGNEIGIEKNIVGKYGYELKFVSARWLLNKGFKEILLTSLATVKGVTQTLKIMRKFKPDVVIGTGGFVCVPIVIAGKLYGAKTYIHEQNAYPGKANKMLERFCDKVFLGFASGKKYFKEQNKLIEVGNPVRQSFYAETKDAARKALNLPEHADIVFLFGGSQGSRRLNEVAIDLVKKINGNEKIVFNFCTGPNYFEEVIDTINLAGIELKDNIHILSYIDDMEKYLHSADIVVGRAGALSIAEIATCGKASIMIPSPNVTANHQFYNAKAMSDEGAAILIEEKELTSEVFTDNVLKLCEDKELLRGMTEKAKNIQSKNTVDIIYDVVLRDLKLD